MSNDIHQASRYLEKHLGQGRGQRLQLLKAVAALSGRARLAALLRSLLADRQALTTAAQRSYRHPLGFDKLVLVTSPALDFQLSLHLWPSEGQNALEDVHNHRFAFASVVLDGALEMETFERVEGGLHMREYESVPGEEIGVSRFRHVGDAALGCSFSARMPAGTLYHLSARTLHRITAVGDHRAETATLFLQGSIQQPSTSVLSDHSIGRRPTIVRPTMAPDLFAERVRGYIQELETTRAA